MKSRLLFLLLYELLYYDHIFENLELIQVDDLLISCHKLMMTNQQDVFIRLQDMNQLSPGCVL